MFYGWGTNSQQFTAPDGRPVVCVYKYVSAAFIFKFVRKQQWFVADADGEQREITRDELDQLFSPEESPNLSLWLRFGLAAPLLGVVAVAVVGAVASAGTSMAANLAAGDCFVDAGPEVEEVSRVETPDCSEPHDSQVTAVFDLAGQDDAAFPSPADPVWDQVTDRCVDHSLDTLVRIDDVPDDGQLLFLSPSEPSWDSGDREIICYLHSAEGLDGSFIEETP